MVMKWLTPSGTPTGTRKIELLVPDHAGYEAAIRGALVPLLSSLSWEEFGDNTPDQASEIMRETVLDTISKWEECSVVGHTIGEVFFFAAETAPASALVCDGASLARSEYPQLFAVIGISFGAVDSSHFSLPNLEARAPIGTGQITGGTLRELGDTGGSETKAITASNLPEHTHSVGVSSQNILAGIGNQTAVIRTGGSINTGSAGFGTPINIMPPFLALTPCIWFE